jgi:hypothetical protein
MSVGKDQIGPGDQTYEWENSKLACSGFLKK